MIIKAKHHKIIYPFFKNYANWKIKKHFHKVHIQGEYEEKHLPLLIISNHFSWWDGFWLNYLNTKLFRRKFHFMMLEEQLRRYWFFKYTGGFSVRKSSRSIVETIKYTSELLSDSRNIVLMFPQGEIQSLYTRSFNFEKGVESIINNTANEIQILFVANLVDYFSNPKPCLFVYLTEYKSDNFQIGKIQSSYNRFYEQCLSENQKLRDL
jgi:1-acyl-sn-glycerol-3-phosphate acyltransferase